MKKFIKYFLFFFAFTACNTLQHQQRKAEIFYSQHPEKLAAKCVETFVEKDSTGKADTVYEKADNQDYTKAIDSLQILLDSAIENATVIEVNDNDSTTYYAEVARVKALKNQLISLQSSYKPCKSDTLKIYVTTFKQSPQLLARNAYYSYQNDSLKTALVQRDTQLSDARKTAANRLWWIIGLAVVLAAGTFLKIKNII